MVASLNVNPMATTNAQGTFRLLSDGFIQGMAMDDPAIRNALVGGVLSASESLPMWGGVGIAELIAQAASSTTHVEELGNDISRATGLSTSLALTGFSVFDQAHHMVQTPQSPVPIALSGMSVHFYRLGSGARIPVACTPNLVSAERGQLITNQVSWDFVGQKLVPFSAAYAQATISGAVWASTNGGQVQFTINQDYTSLINAGDWIYTSGVINTGGASTGAFNGPWQVVSVDDATHITVVATASASIGTYSSGGIVAAGGGALPVKVLAVKGDNCMTVNYSDPTQSPNPGTGYATWNTNGSCALIQI